ncbi:MAG: type II secretion system F family protein [Candidatus Firestonebacteria bacterium]
MIAHMYFTKKAMVILSVSVFFLMLVLSGLFLAVFSAAAVSLVPSYVKHRAHKKNTAVIDGQFLDALDLIVNCLKAGLSLQQALSEVVKDVKGPVSDEFKEVLAKYRLGIPMAKALNTMAVKFRNENVELLSLTVGITLEAGGNMSEVLEKVAANMREKSRLEAKIETLTAQGRLSGIIIGTLPFILSLSIYLVDSELMTPMFTTLKGSLLLFAALLMEVAGFLMIRKITNIRI